jgi:hypothetical protein
MTTGSRIAARPDRAQAEQAERAYRRITEHWRRQNKREAAGAADEARY